MVITSLMIAPGDNNDNNKRRKKERRTGGKTGGNVQTQSLKSWKRPPLSVKGEGGRREQVPGIVTAYSPSWKPWASSGATEKKRERTAESEKGKRKERKRERKKEEAGYLLISLQSRCCSRRHTIKVEKAKVSSHDACIEDPSEESLHVRAQGIAGSLVLELVVTRRENGIFFLSARRAARASAKIVESWSPKFRGKRGLRPVFVVHSHSKVVSNNDC